MAAINRVYAVSVEGCRSASRHGIPRHYARWNLQQVIRHHCGKWLVGCNSEGNVRMLAATAKIASRNHGKPKKREVCKNDFF